VSLILVKDTLVVALLFGKFTGTAQLFNGHLDINYSRKAAHSMHSGNLLVLSLAICIGFAFSFLYICHLSACTDGK